MQKQSSPSVGCLGGLSYTGIGVVALRQRGRDDFELTTSRQIEGDYNKK